MGIQKGDLAREVGYLRFQEDVEPKSCPVCSEKLNYTFTILMEDKLGILREVHASCAK
jgi:hypothetical protein